MFQIVNVNDHLKINSLESKVDISVDHGFRSWVIMLMVVSRVIPRQNRQVSELFKVLHELINDYKACCTTNKSLFRAHYPKILLHAIVQKVSMRREMIYELFKQALLCKLAFYFFIHL